MLDPSRLRPAPPLLVLSLTTVVLAGCSGPTPAAAPPTVIDREAVSASSTATPVASPSTQRAKGRLSLGDNHGCVIGENGHVYCWGKNDEGELGDGTVALRAEPVEVHGLTDVVSVSAGGTITCAVDKPGAVYCWGGIRNPRRMEPQPVKGITHALQVSVGDYHACAVLEGGKVMCWGSSSAGQLGTAEKVPDEDTPVPVANLTSVVEVGTGHGDSCARQKSGAVWCWGQNGERSSPTPVRVEGLPPVQALRMTWEQACGLRDDGHLMCWGATMSGHDFKNPEPTEVPGLSGVVDFDVGSFDLCAMLDSGEVKCLGSSGPPELVKGYTGYLIGPPREVSVGHGMTCVRATDGSVRCHGSNIYGELGNGESAEFRKPSRISGTENTVDVMPGTAGGCVLDADHHVSCWGAGHALRPGESTAAQPQRIALEKVTRLLRGFDDSEACATLANGELWCFPSSRPDHAGASSAPVKVAGLRQVVSLEPAGFRGVTLFAVLESGDLVSVTPGATKNGERKVETTRLGGVGKVTAVASNYDSACAVRRDKKVECFKVATSGPFDPHASDHPFEVPKIAKAVAVGESTHWCARTEASEVWCWKFESDPRDKLVLNGDPLLQSELAGAKNLWLDGALVFELPDGTLVRDKDEHGAAGWSGNVLPLYPASYGGASLVRGRSTRCLIDMSKSVSCWGTNYGNAVGSTIDLQSPTPVLVKLPTAALAH